MEINKPLLGAIITQKRAINSKTQLELQQESLLGYSVVDKDDNTIAALVEANSNATIYEIADKIAVHNANSTTTTNIKNAGTDLTIKSGLSITLGDLNKAQLAQIKQVIYDLHHAGNNGDGQGTDPVTPDNPVNPPADDDDDSDSDTDTDIDLDPDKESFLNEFNDVDTLFEWLNTQDDTITKSGGLSASQLWKLTQRDNWEESHYYFFGQLNKIFTELDDNSDRILSYDELKSFFGNEMGSLANYYANVQMYANQIQSEFATKTKQQKLEFIIDTTRKYFEAAGLTDQIQALERLIAKNKINFKDLNPGGGGTTLGMYVYQVNVSDGHWNNDDPATCGLFIDSNLINNSSTQWYELVDVMVHEVTHATAYLYPDNLPKSNRKFNCASNNKAMTKINPVDINARITAENIFPITNAVGSIGADK
mgnify:CR=1 FL=1